MGLGGSCSLQTARTFDIDGIHLAAQQGSHLAGVFTKKAGWQLLIGC